MVFSSHLFLFWFLPIVLLGYYACPSKGRTLFLTLLSYFFYGWANPLFVFLMFFSTVVDYICGLVIAAPARGPNGEIEALDIGAPRTRSQRTALIVSILTNLSLLGFFKYFNFFVDSVNELALLFGAAAPLFERTLNVVLPLGISFYTFQSMSYSIDCYRGEAKAIRKFVDFSCYVSLFPQLVAGPIIRFQEVADQIITRSHTPEKFARGVAFFALGMTKKIWLANPAGNIADLVFNAGAVSTTDAWYGTLAYAFQIYFDFSAYTDMAIGLGLMIGFVFPKNFDSPYHAASITEFWRRWHISLSTWLREYLYIPLGGNRRGVHRTYINLALVMLIGGLWHGAAWTFVVWGGIHGVFLALERAFKPNLPRLLGKTVTFFIVCVAWIFFRANTVRDAFRMVATLFGGGGDDRAALVGGQLYSPYFLLSMAAAALITWFAPQTWDWTRKLPAWKIALTLLALFASAGYMTIQAFNPFIYFIF
ncbi:MAG: MBOAT family protein [Verrucomicrobia bacterium]|nr:MBOAT family protein [Verrucomicrobiota bacterium]MCH8527952.1 MBOAT family protein [Kiritimatiellia bacterium]